MLNPQEKERVGLYQQHMEDLNTMSHDELATLVSDDKCPYKPELLTGLPIGMHHCPVCTDMVVAGIKHHRRSDMPFTDEELTELAEAGSDVDQKDV